MTLQQLMCICAVADSGLNVSRAADTLHMTQPGVSKMVRALEHELNVEIFIRKGNRLTGVTDAGREALALARRVMSDKKLLLGLAAQTQAESSGTLRIGTSPLHARYALLQAVQRFSETYPAVSLEMMQGRPAEIVNAVASGEIDLGVGTVPGKLPASVITLDAYPIEYCLIVPRKHPLLQLTRVSIEDIANYPLITYNETFNSGIVVHREFQRRGLAPHIAMKAADANVVKAYVASGLGVGVVLKMAIEPKRDRDLRIVAADHIFPASIAKISLRRDGPRRGFVYDFVQLVSSKWTREAVAELLASNRSLYRVPA
ncbi:MAG: LysR family transcriptional regulator [Betaproteobacteria bacterium]|nr:LysR family transcriptional regulator [Betaproteobacteria bacterium]